MKGAPGTDPKGEQESGITAKHLAAGNVPLIVTGILLSLFATRLLVICRGEPAKARALLSQVGLFEGLFGALFPILPAIVLGSFVLFLFWKPDPRKDHLGSFVLPGGASLVLMALLGPWPATLIGVGLAAAILICAVAVIKYSGPACAYSANQANDPKPTSASNQTQCKPSPAFRWRYHFPAITGASMLLFVISPFLFSTVPGLPYEQIEVTTQGGAPVTVQGYVLAMSDTTITVLADVDREIVIVPVRSVTRRLSCRVGGPVTQKPVWVRLFVHNSARRPPECGAPQQLPEDLNIRWA